MKFGLIGTNISYSISPFIHTFLLDAYGIEAGYELIDIPDEKQLKAFLHSQRSNYRGLNVTIPYKQMILTCYNDVQLSAEVQAIGSTNCLDIQTDHVFLHNTDAYGFIQPLLQYTQHHNKKTLILGNGGAMKAVYYALKQTYPTMMIDVVARTPRNQELTYTDLTPKMIDCYGLIVNTTPVSPYQFKQLKTDTILYDLNYRIERCQFLNQHPDTIHINGITMLVYQAVRSFEIWHQCDVDQLIIDKLFKEIEVEYGIKQ